ncbi:transcriptional repressor [Sulfuriroseicoccus oceanibius]|uniref:Transcriptional repressor n=2 Tax=Sulfuriroseicoccus oceanibius TaxID=2707525 RepID=A0A6B3L8G3_9BACT|nr:transcriptional repressor [Sulfuriroseicoccus oceanibius]
MGERNHPTANELFIKAQEHIPGISLATVYNSLEAMTQSGLVKQVNIDRSPSRYCPNLRPHAHLLREDTGEVIDVPLKEGASLSDVFDLPDGIEMTAADITFKGMPLG